MNIGRILQVFLARWKIILLVFLLASCVGVPLAYYSPKSYTSTATVVVDARTDPVAGLSQIATPNFLTTQIDIIKSSRVGNKVIKTLKLDQNPMLRQQYVDSKAQASFDEWLSNLLQKALVAEVGRGSNVIRISYSSLDPKFSAVMANAFVKAYLDTVLELRVEPARRYADFFDDRSKGMRDTVEKAQTKLSSYQKEKGLVGSDERSDIENSKLNELSQQLLQAQSASIDAASKQNQAQIASDRSQEVINNSLINGFKSELAKQETKLQELISKFGDAHPQVIETRVTVAEMRSKIDTEIKRITSSTGVTTSVYRQRESEIRAALEAQRAKVLKLKEVRDDLTVLQRDVEIAQRAYDNVQQRLNQSTLESQNQLSSISVLSQAEISNESKSQLFMKNAAKALAVAFALALAIAFVLEFFDKRVRVLDDIADIADLPVIGVMPKPDKAGIFGRVRPSQLQKRILRQLPRPT